MSALPSCDEIIRLEKDKKEEYYQLCSFVANDMFDKLNTEMRKSLHTHNYDITVPWIDSHSTRYKHTDRPEISKLSEYLFTKKVLLSGYMCDITRDNGYFLSEWHIKLRPINYVSLILYGIHVDYDTILQKYNKSTKGFINRIKNFFFRSAKSTYKPAPQKNRPNPTPAPPKKCNFIHY